MDLWYNGLQGRVELGGMRRRANEGTLRVRRWLAILFGLVTLMVIDALIIGRAATGARIFGPA
jgi:hypothetical protein